MVVAVRETFFTVTVRDMERARGFYVAALGATVASASPRWSSLCIAGVRVSLFLDPGHAPDRIGLHFVVDDLPRACESIGRAGGRVVAPATEVAPGVVTCDVADTEGNVLTLVQGGGATSQP